MKSHRGDAEHAEFFRFFPCDLCVLCGEKWPDPKIGESTGAIKTIYVMGDGKSGERLRRDAFCFC
jgi:hypothetical protein